MVMVAYVMVATADVKRNPQIYAICSALFSVCGLALPNLRLEGCTGTRMQFLGATRLNY